MLTFTLAMSCLTTSNLPWSASLVAQMVKHLPAMWETWFRYLDWDDPLGRKWQPTPVLLSGKLHGWKSLGSQESDTTEQLHFGPKVPGSYATFLFTASGFTSITSHIHNWVLFLLSLCLFSLSGVICPLTSSSILDTYWPGEFVFQCPVFLPFHTVHGVLKTRYWSGLPFPSSVDIFSELSTMTHPSWVVIHSMAHSFIELDKAVVHVIRLASFLWLWFSVCLPSDGEG